MEIPIPALRMPTFLQPLQLIPYWQNRIGETIQGWIRRSDQQLFGPLEQMVAAAVVIGLAMQTPNEIWIAPSIPSKAPYPLTNSFDTNHARNIHRPPFPASENSHPSNPMTWIQLLLESVQEHVNPTTLGLIAMLINLIIMFVPDDLKKRLVDSWRLFWPPWQDRSGGSEVRMSESERARAEKGIGVEGGEKMADDEGRSKLREKVKVREREEEKGKEKNREKETSPGRQPTNREAVLIGDSRKELPEEEKPKVKEKGTEKVRSEPSGNSATGANLTDEEKIKAKEKQKARRKAEEMQGVTKEGRGLTEEEKGGLREKERAGRRAEAADGNTPVTERSVEKGTFTDLTESERARRKKDGNEIVVPTGKGKERMAGERPGEPTPKSALTETVTDPIKSKDTSTPHEPSKPQDPAPEPDSANETDRSIASSPTSGSDTGDPLMAGDYRPLRSSLKKPHKKPRQHKNIHHNYFMTMRGHRPHLVPFPHGVHPKAHHPRNDLWWDNVPKDVDHIMARPPVLKKPEEGGEEDEDEEVKVTTITDTDVSESSSGETKAKAESKKVTELREKVQKEDTGEDKVRRGVKREGSGETDGTPSTSRLKASSSGREGETVADKREAKENDGEKGKAEKSTSLDKEKERAKLKMEAEAKDKAKAKVEAEAQAKSREGPSKSIGPLEKEIPIDPQVLKATYVSQGFLCVLLYTVNEQLGLLLLAFFVYQHINKHKSSTLASIPSISPTNTSRATSASSSQETSSSSRARAARKEGGIPPEMEAKLEKAEAQVKPAHSGSASRDDAKSSSADGDEALPSVMQGKLAKAEAATDPRAAVRGGDSASRSRSRQDLISRSESTEDHTGISSRRSDTKEGQEKKNQEAKPGKVVEPRRRARVEDADDMAELGTKGRGDIHDEPVPDEATRYERAKERRESRLAAGISLVGGGSQKGDGRDVSLGAESPHPSESKPKTFEDLSPEQKERYIKAKAAKRDAKPEVPPNDAKAKKEPTSGEAKERGSESKRKAGDASEGGAKGDGITAQRDRQRERAVEKKPKPRRLEDLTEEEKDQYMQARAQRKAKERAKLKRGESSGLSAEEKAEISSP